MDVFREKSSKKYLFKIKYVFKVNKQQKFPSSHFSSLFWWAWLGLFLLIHGRWGIHIELLLSKLIKIYNSFSKYSPSCRNTIGYDGHTFPQCSPWSIPALLPYCHLPSDEWFGMSPHDHDSVDFGQCTRHATLHRCHSPGGIPPIATWRFWKRYSVWRRMCAEFGRREIAGKGESGNCVKWKFY